MTLTSDQIAADSITVTLDNGTELTLRYNGLALRELERMHGSIGALGAKLEQGDKGPIFSTIQHAIWAGTNMKMPLDAFLSLLRPRDFESQSAAFFAAFARDMGVTEDTPGEDKAAPAV